MCGLFGFVSKDRGAMNMNIIERLAEITERRGRHAWGIAWVDSRGRLRAYKQPGPISRSLDLLGIAADSQMLIGHCRYATHGDYNENLNNHPHPCDGGWVMHNGIISHYQKLVDDYALNMSTECDSEVVGLLIERFTGSLMQRCIKATEICRGGSPFAMLGLWRNSMVIARANGQPLHVGETSLGYYIASMKEGLPGSPYEIENNTVAIMGGQRSTPKAPPAVVVEPSKNKRLPFVH